MSSADIMTLRRNTQRALGDAPSWESYAPPIDYGSGDLGDGGGGGGGGDYSGGYGGGGVSTLPMPTNLPPSYPQQPGYNPNAINPTVSTIAQIAGAVARGLLPPNAQYATNPQTGANRYVVQPNGQIYDSVTGSIISATNTATNITSSLGNFIKQNPMIVIAGIAFFAFTRKK